MNIFKNWQKRKHFKKKIRATEWKMWDIEFLKEQYKLTREGFRVEYDRLRELQDAAEVRINAEKEKEDPDKTIVEQLTKLRERYEPDVVQLKKQMDTMDLLIEGPAPQGSPQKPLNETIEGLREVISLLKEKIKKL